MKCQYCGKNEAVYQYTITMGNRQVERFLCAECAKKLGYEAEQSGFSFDQLFSDFLSGQFATQESQQTEDGEALTCPQCGSTWSAIQNTGKVGCAECYRVFSNQLLPYVQKLHGTTLHKGRAPKAAAAAQQAETALEALQAKMEAAVAEQNYEQAAIYRDEIRGLKGGAGE